MTDFFQLTNVSKRFGDKKALDSVSTLVTEGVLAIVVTQSIFYLMLQWSYARRDLV